MHPVAGVLFGRADARRTSLLGLAASVPEQLWGRRPAGGEWTAREHLAHALSADAVVALMVRRFEPASFFELGIRRQAALELALSRTSEELLRAAAEEREELRRVLQGVSSSAFEAAVTIQGSGTSFSLLTYLQAWASHDGEHELAIRQAIAVPPDLSAIAYSRRLS